MDENQKRYFYEMFDMYVHKTYYSKCLDWCKSFDKWIQIIVSIITIVGISVLQSKFKNIEIWFYLMVGLQILSLILSLFFDAKGKIIKLELLLKELNTLYIEIANEWFNVSNGNLSRFEIHKLWLDFKKRNDSLELPDGTIGWFWYMSSSEKEAKTYFDKYYPKE